MRKLHYDIIPGNKNISATCFHMSCSVNCNFKSFNPFVLFKTLLKPG